MASGDAPKPSNGDGHSSQQSPSRNGFALDTAMQDHAVPRVMSHTERLLREAVCPKTLPCDEAAAAISAGVTLGDRLLLDGTASVHRLSVHAAPKTMRRLSSSMQRLSSVGTSLRSSLYRSGIDDTQQPNTLPTGTDGAATGSRRACMPPPAPAPIASEAAAAAIEAAKARRRASLKNHELIDPVIWT